MNKKHWSTRYLGWLLSGLLIAIFYVLIFQNFDTHYANNDDTVILRATMGYGGVMPTFNVILHGLLLAPLTWLGTMFPGIAFYTYFQIFFLWLSGTVFLRGLICLAVNNYKPFWVGLLAGLLFICCFWIQNATKITMTITAALLSAAAVMQILSVDIKNSNLFGILRGMLLATLLCILGYAMRSEVLLPTLGFCGIAFLYQWLRYISNKNIKFLQAKPMLISLALILVLVGGSYGMRMYEIYGNEVHKAEWEWNTARSAVMDYYEFKELPQEAIDEFNISPELLNLSKTWYLLDPVFTTENFQKMLSYLEENKQDNSVTFSKQLDELFKGISKYNKEQLYYMPISLLLFIFALCLATKRKYCYLPLILSFILFVFALIALFINGRLPLRSIMVPLSAFAVFSFAFFVITLPSKQTTCISIFIPIVVVCILGLSVQLPNLLEEKYALYDERNDINAFDDVDAFALEYPDMLIISDDTLVSDFRLFPNTSNGIPNNVIWWGGWGLHSQQYRTTLKNFGFDPDTVDGTIFLDPNVYLARSAIDPEPIALANYIQSLFDEELAYYMDLTLGGGYFYTFY